MKNLFDVGNYPDGVPLELFAGYRWAWTASNATAVYPTDTYTLKYILARLDDPEATFDVTAGKGTGAHIVEIGHEATIEYVPGEYVYRAYIVRDSDSEEVQIEAGNITVSASYQYDGDEATWVYKVLIAVRAALAQTASTDQLELEVAGRRLVRRSPEDLMMLEKDFSQRWATIKEQRARAAGKSTDNRVLVTMRA